MCLTSCSGESARPPFFLSSSAFSLLYFSRKFKPSVQSITSPTVPKPPEMSCRCRNNTNTFESPLKTRSIMILCCIFSFFTSYTTLEGIVGVEARFFPSSILPWIICFLKLLFSLFGFFIRFWPGCSNLRFRRLGEPAKTGARALLGSRSSRLLPSLPSLGTSFPGGVAISPAALDSCARELLLVDPLSVLFTARELSFTLSIS
mmetsp:Transcript_11510/g.18435  ORF Transcript_11510/g.18435 Transcript_11510/m.18435 type:complete len:204 (+) Transcript_11510:354-965(+)